MLREVRAKAPMYADGDQDAHFNAEQNALIVQHAERYYRTMIQGGATSWNVRDRHMVETLDRLVAHHGPRSKAIVWEHNTHIGDARYTDMGRHGMVNVGQLVREAHGERPTAGDGVMLVGFVRLASSTNPVRNGGGTTCRPLCLGATTRSRSSTRRMPSIRCTCRR